MIIDKKIIRTLNKEKVKYFCMCFLIILSGVLFISINTAANSLSESIEEFMEKNNVESAQFFIQNNLNDDEIKKYENDFDILLEEQKTIDYKMENESVIRIFNECKRVNTYGVLSGKRLQNDNEMLISKHYAEKNSIKIGDNISINGCKITVVGYMTKPDYLFTIKNDTDLINKWNKFGVAVVRVADFDSLGNAFGYYSVRAKDETVLSKFKEQLGNDNILINWVKKDDNQRICNINGTIDTFSVVGKVVPVSILIVICAMIAVLLGRLIKEEYGQLGMLSALGYRKKEVYLHYIKFALFICILGSTIALIPGVLLSKPLISILNIKYEMPDVAVHIKPSIILSFLVMPFIFLIPITMLVVRKALHIPILDLIRNGGRKKKITWIEKKINLNRLGFKNKFRIREILRNFQRVLIIICGAILSAILLLFGFVMNDSLEYIVNGSMKDTYKYKTQYMFSSLQNTEIENMEKLNYSSFEVKRKSEEYSFVIYGIQTDSKMYCLNDFNGNKIDYNNTIITKPLADKLDVKNGDSLVVMGKYNEKEYTVKIDDIADSYVGEMIFMPLNNFNDMMQYPEGSYLGLLSNENIEPDVDSSYSTMNMDEFINDYRSMLIPIKYFVGVMAIIAFIIGLIIIYVLTVMLIEENSNQISLLKVMGYNNKRIFSLLVDPTSIFVVIGFIIGSFLITPIMKKLFEIMAAGMSITIKVDVEYRSLIISFVILMICFYIAKKMTQKKVINIPMAAALKNRAE